MVSVIKRLASQLFAGFIMCSSSSTNEQFWISFSYEKMWKREQWWLTEDGKMTERWILNMLPGSFLVGGDSGCTLNRYGLNIKYHTQRGYTGRQFLNMKNHYRTSLNIK
jgi:hypothetical protein